MDFNSVVSSISISILFFFIVGLFLAYVKNKSAKINSEINLQKIISGIFIPTALSITFPLNISPDMLLYNSHNLFKHLNFKLK